MRIEFQASGEVVERQELLNGGQSVSVEAVSVDGGWRLTGLMTWNIGLKENTGEGDITLTRDDGAELFGSLMGGSVMEADGDDDVDHRFNLSYQIDGGSAEFDSASGQVEASGALAGGTVSGVWSLLLNP